jgi:hypothetical protein
MHHNKQMKINENKGIQITCQLMSAASQWFKSPDPVYELVNPKTGKSKWELVEITCPWPWIDFDGETLEKAYQKRVAKYDVLRNEPKKEYPHQGVEQATIVVDATGVFHKRAQIEFVKATRLQKKDLARFQRNVVDMAIHWSYQSFHKSMEKARYNKQFHPTPEIIAELEKLVVDLMLDADEEPVDIRWIRMRRLLASSFIKHQLQFVWLQLKRSRRFLFLSSITMVTRIRRNLSLFSVTLTSFRNSNVRIVCMSTLQRWIQRASTRAHEL